MTIGSTDTPDGVHSTGESEGGALTDHEISDNVATNTNNEAFDVLFGEELEEWPEQASKKGFRAPWPVTVLVALLLLVGGLSLGAFLQRGQSSSTTSAAGAGRAAFAGAFGGAAAGASTATGASTGAASTTSNITSGTVTDIIGQTLYVTNSSGALVAVKVSSSTTIDRNAASTLSGLKPGDTVTVEGPTAKNGSVTAATISATAKGVTVVGGFGGGGFGGLGGGGTGATAGG